MTELRRTLGLGEVSFFAAGVILGAGIYTVIGEAAGIGGNMLWLSFLIASFTALLTAFAYAELVALFPKAGGEFSYVKESINAKLAYVIGIAVALSGIVAGATIAVGFAGYFSQLLQFNETLTALGIVALIWIINVIGIRQSSVTNIIFTLIEIGGLGYVIWAAWPKIGTVDYTELPPEGINGIFAAAAISFFAFTGFEDAVKLAEETKKPEKNVPRALFIASAVVIVLYMAVVIAAVSAVPFEELGRSKSPLSVIAESRYGKMGATIIAVIALFSTSNSLLSNMLGGSRITYSMAKEKDVKLLRKVSPKRRTPVRALILIAICIAAFSFIGEVKTIALIANFFVFATFFLLNVSVLYLRVKDPDRERPFRIPGNMRNIPLITVVAIIMILVLVCYTIYGLTLK
jgi:basic amino acid/polyamine antiporter, APA family